MGLLVFFLDFFLLWTFFRSKGHSSSGSFLFTLSGLSFYLWLSTELLSGLELIGMLSLNISWGFLGLLIFTFLPKNELWQNRFFLPQRIPNYWIPGLIVILVSLLIGLSSIPNNWDSMTYHLPRIFHWIQNGSVQHYSTSCLRQIQLQPFSELFGLHIYALSWGWFNSLNLVQLLFFIGCLSCVDLMSKELVQNKRARQLAMIFAATIPMAIIQSNSTQNDVVASFWFLMAFYGLTLLRKNWTYGHFMILILGAGFGILTKGTLYVFFLPIFLGFLVLIFSHYRKHLFWKTLSLGLIILLLNSTYWYRNYQSFGWIFGPKGGSKIYFVQESGIRSFISNTVKNTAQGLAFSEVFCPDSFLQNGAKSYNSAINIAVQYFFKALGISINYKHWDWPRVPWNWSVINNPHFGFHEDYAPSPIHTWVLILLPFFGLSGQKEKKLDFLKAYLIPVLGFILFSLLLRWQPWHQRLELPLYFGMAPVVGLVFGRKSNISMVFGFLLAAYSLGPLILNKSRPILPISKFPLNISNETTLFVNRPYFLEGHLEAQKFLKELNPESIGLAFEEDSWEFPIWVISKDLDNPRVFHFDPSYDMDLPKTESFPEVLVTTDESDKSRIPSNYEQVLETSFYDVFALKE